MGAEQGFAMLAGSITRPGGRVPVMPSSARGKRCLTSDAWPSRRFSWLPRLKKLRGFG
jgi:hypothetical protein